MYVYNGIYTHVSMCIWIALRRRTENLYEKLGFIWWNHPCWLCVWDHMLSIENRPFGCVVALFRCPKLATMKCEALSFFRWGYLTCHWPSKRKDLEENMTADAMATIEQQVRSGRSVASESLDIASRLGCWHFFRGSMPIPIQKRVFFKVFHILPSTSTTTINQDHDHPSNGI